MIYCFAILIIIVLRWFAAAVCKLYKGDDEPIVDKWLHTVSLNLVNINEVMLIAWRHQLITWNVVD